MTLEINQLEKKDINDYVRHWTESYSGLGFDTKDKIEKKCSLIKGSMKIRSELYSVKKKGGPIIGGFRLFNQKVHVHNKELEAYAFGSVFVALDERKKGVSKKIVEYVHKKSLENKIPLIMLYPFKSQFYKNFGYGEGAPIFSYSIKPEQLKESHLRKNVIRSFSEKDISYFYDKFYKTKNGLSKRTQETFKEYLAFIKKKIFVYKEKKEIKGYILLEILPSNKKNFLKNSIVVHELFYLEPYALKGILGFLRSLSHQVDKISINSFDPHFYLNIINPEIEKSPIIHPVYQVSHKASLGIMYRINGIEFLKSLDRAIFGAQNLSIKFNVIDDLSFDTIHQFYISFSNGKLTLHKKRNTIDSSIKISLSHFSSLFMGSVSFQSLYELGHIEIKEKTLVKELNKIFLTLKPPQNLDVF